jgi:processing peptidase subunit alpha
MLQRGLSRLHSGLVRAASRGLHTSKAAAGTAAGDGSSGAGAAQSFPAWLPSGSLRVSTPLTHALPGVDGSSGFTGAGDELPPTEVTVLPNGVRIVSEASMVSRAAAQRGCGWC